MKQAYLEFKKPVDFKNGYIAQTNFPIEENPLVMITDISKDQWQLPVVGYNLMTGQYCESIDVGNPKLKRMSKEEFNRIFNITHIH